jgi:thiamine pyrophosphokinase
MSNRQGISGFSEPFVVILANGTFPQTNKTCSYLSSASRLICCDGAANKAVARGYVPDAIVGDLDSLDPSIKERFPNRIIRITEQETNDLSKAFNYCVSQGWSNIVILGASGEREDHLLGNISLLADFAVKAKSVRIITDFGYFCATNQSKTFHVPKGSQISIFSLNPQQEITSRGLRYPLNRLRLTRWHMGTLNEALTDKFSLELTGDSPVILFVAD